MELAATTEPFFTTALLEARALAEAQAGGVAIETEGAAVAIDAEGAAVAIETVPFSSTE